MSDEKKTVTDDSDCDDCFGDEDDTHLVHKPKTSGKLTPIKLHPRSLRSKDNVRYH